MQRARDVLTDLGVPGEVKVISAHRKPARLVEYITDAEARGVRVFIAGAGGAAHIAGVIAAHTTRPVLAVPIKTDLAGGLDSLLSMVQMPKGIPVGCLATGNDGATNAGILAAQILATHDEALARRVADHRRAQAESLSESPE
jgi:5-(carboxyamino)imidazole ribonucleotide mutase